MNILWITNIPLPPICQSINISTPVVGGWMYASAQLIAKEQNIRLSIATPYSGKIFIDKEIDGIRYFLIPLNGANNTKYQKKLEVYWKKIHQLVKPDIIHIHGTEFAHGLSYIKACGSQKVVISIQGLVSCIANYYLAGITDSEILKSITIRDIIRKDNLFQQKKKFEQRGLIEIQLLKSVKHIIGRTSWDKAHTWSINPDAQYHFCGETLRKEFYQHTWKYCNCEKHSIFLSQGSYPIKGLHKVIEAIPFVLKEYPDCHLYIAGDNIIDKQWYRISGYGQYIKRLIKRHNLHNYITFVGNLSERDMCMQYLRSNLFICPSAIENSPNSLAEAQVIGIPYLASYVGGVPDFINNSDLLYRYEETEMLADKICTIFKLENRAAQKTKSDANKFNPIGNRDSLINIYSKIL